jgi:hypothetical protein
MQKYYFLTSEISQINFSTFAYLPINKSNNNNIHWPLDQLSIENEFTWSHEFFGQAHCQNKYPVLKHKYTLRVNDDGALGKLNIRTFHN